MYKLMVIAGPTAGSSFSLRDGENSIGRQGDNVIVLTSPKVSKKHCVLVVNNERLELKDHESANGTFVNGILTKSKEVQAGDRISVGEFVFEVRNAQVIQLRLHGKGAQLPGLSKLAPTIAFDGSAVDMNAVMFNPDNATFVEKAMWHFENYIMPFFYNINLRHEWRFISAGLIALFVVFSVVFAIYPLLQTNHDTLVLEAGRRARLIAKQIVEKNAPYLAEDAENRTEIGSFQNDFAIKTALLVRLDLRVLSPPERLNSYLASGVEAVFAKQIAERFRQGREVGTIKEVDRSTVIAIEPLKLLRPELGRNEVVAMAVVSLDTSLSTPDIGTIGVTYSSTLIVTGLLAALLGLILYRLALKRFEILNEDIDRVLKGLQENITKDFKFEEGDHLWEVIQSSLQLIPKKGDGDEEIKQSQKLRIDDVFESMRLIGEASKIGIGLFDEARKTVYLNPSFEDLTGIRFDDAENNFISMVVRDQAFGALLDDMFESSKPGISKKEDFDFSGVPFVVQMAVLGESQLSGYVLTISPKSESSEV